MVYSIFYIFWWVGVWCGLGCVWFWLGWVGSGGPWVEAGLVPVSRPVHVPGAVARAVAEVGARPGSRPVPVHVSGAVPGLVPVAGLGWLGRLR